MPFIDDVAAAYGWADLIICRAGALTISELAAAGLGAILDAVSDRRSTITRRVMRSTWWMRTRRFVLPQSELTPKRLAAEIARCIDDRELVKARAMRARELARPDATRDVADLCLAAGDGCHEGPDAQDRANSLRGHRGRRHGRYRRSVAEPGLCRTGVRP